MTLKKLLCTTKMYDVKYDVFSMFLKNVAFIGLTEMECGIDIHCLV